MKRTNPELLRLGYNKTWLNHFNVVNYNASVPIMIKSSIYLFNWINSCKLTKNNFFCPIGVSSFINSSKLTLYFKYFFFNKKILLNNFKKLTLNKKRALKKKWWFSFFISHIFWKFENYFWRLFKIPVTIIKFNLYKLAFSHSFFNLLFKLKESITWKKIKIDNLVILLLYSLYYKNVFLLANTLANEFKKRKQHSLTIKVLTHIISSLLKFVINIKGVIFHVSGRLNNKDRTQSKIFFFGNRFQIQKFSTNFAYCYKNVVTPIGVFGIKVWLY